MSTEQAVVLAAIAATVYALLTFLLLLEARGARIRVAHLTRNQGAKNRQMSQCGRGFA